MNIRILVLFALTAFVVSCAPAHSVKRYGISAALTDGDTATSIADATVVVTIDDDTFKRTSDRNGVVRVDPSLRLHMNWLGGSAIQSDPYALIIVSCDGYDAAKVEWFRHFPDRNSGLVEDRGVIDLGKLALSKSKKQQVVGGDRR